MAESLIRELEAVTFGEMFRNALIYSVMVVMVTVASFIGALMLFAPYRVFAYFVGHAEIVFLVMFFIVAECVGTYFSQFSKNLKMGKPVERSLEDVVEGLKVIFSLMKIILVLFYVRVTVFVAAGYLLAGLGLTGMLVLFVLMMFDVFLEKYGWGIRNIVFRMFRKEMSGIKEVTPLQAAVGIRENSL